MGKPSHLEARFHALWRQLGGTALDAEVKFHPSRRWRFDFADTAARVAIEVEGGIWGGGRHTRGKGFEGDCEKYNAAALAGWRVFRFTGGMLREECVAPVIAICKGEKE